MSATAVHACSKTRRRRTRSVYGRLARRGRRRLNQPSRTRPAGASKRRSRRCRPRIARRCCSSAVEGMKPAEAAAVCGVTPEAMRQRLSRARAAIARHLDECDDTDPGALEGGDHMIEDLPLAHTRCFAQRAHHRALPRSAGRATPKSRGAQSPAEPARPRRGALAGGRFLRGLSHRDGRRPPRHRRAQALSALRSLQESLVSAGEGGTPWSLCCRC